MKTKVPHTSVSPAYQRGLKRVSDRENETMSLWYHDEISHNRNGRKALKSLNPERIYPKHKVGY